SDRRPFPDGVNVPRFRWDGERYGTMLLLDRWNDCVLDGFAFETDDFDSVRGPAGVAIDCDNGQDTNRGDPAIGSTCTFSRLRHITHRPDPSATVRRRNINGETVLVKAPIFLAIATKTQDNQE